jgi:UDP-2,3-diacylglucosamine pyrophosphatase LpxH
MRSTNADMKREFPETLILDYAAPYLTTATAAVVLGHFHLEKELRTDPTQGAKVFVLPEWKGSRRHLRVTADGDMRFEDS